jgi:hypothetical protein
MKKLIIAAAALMVSLAASYGQGTFAFNNRALPDVNAQIKLASDATTSSLDGSSYSWQLEGGAKGTALSAAQILASGTFRSGNAAGYVNPPAAAVVVPGVADAAQADVFLSIFQGATPSGKSLADFGPFTVTLTVPPAVPNTLPLGTSALIVNVPEPTTLALGALGLGALLCFRRRK